MNAPHGHAREKRPASSTRTSLKETPANSHHTNQQRITTIQRCRYRQRQNVSQFDFCRPDEIRAKDGRRDDDQDVDSNQAQQEPERVIRCYKRSCRLLEVTDTCDQLKGHSCSVTDYDYSEHFPSVQNGTFRLDREQQG